MLATVSASIAVGLLPVSLPRHHAKPRGVTVKFGKITSHMGGICWGKGGKAQQAAADQSINRAKCKLCRRQVGNGRWAAI